MLDSSTINLKINSKIGFRVEENQQRPSHQISINNHHNHNHHNHHNRLIKVLTTSLCLSAIPKIGDQASSPTLQRSFREPLPLGSNSAIDNVRSLENIGNVEDIGRLESINSI